jgi:hypothetical protein
MFATIEQDVLNIIENFKKHVNPSFTANSHDLMYIRKMINTCPASRTNGKDGVMYYSVDYATLKKHGVKNFKFSIEDYREWRKETLEELKQDFIQRRKPICL